MSEIIVVNDATLLEIPSRPAQLQELTQEYLDKCNEIVSKLNPHQKLFHLLQSSIINPLTIYDISDFMRIDVSEIWKDSGFRNILFYYRQSPNASGEYLFMSRNKISTPEGLAILAIHKRYPEIDLSSQITQEIKSVDDNLGFAEV